ncbi:MAG: PQQ-dependent sugar dehydrogenase [Patescibacteria group bacterium]
MKKLTFFAIIIIAVGAFAYFYWQDKIPDGSAPPNGNVQNGNPHGNTPAVTVVAENLEIPWDIAFLPDGNMLVSERPGRLSVLYKNGERDIIFEGDAEHVGEGGLLGIALHPKFNENHFIYLYLTVLRESAPASPDAPLGSRGGRTENRVERWRFENDKLADKKLIIEKIPGAPYHDGGRIEFGPDEFLYIATGDATQGNLAQDKNSLAGKILRLEDDGGIPEDNPFKTAVYSYGHRNPQGLAWDSEGRLWSTEHGRSGVLSGLDEINLIRAGGNYGWPTIQGDETKAGMISPVLHSGPNKTWAPASLAYLNKKLYFGGLRGEALYEAIIEGEKVINFKEHFFKEFGRIRTVRVGPDGMLYLTTSNRDDRGTPKAGDDKIIKINPKKL